jgi:hypothetical protein
MWDVHPGVSLDGKRNRTAEKQQKMKDKGAKIRKTPIPGLMHTTCKKDMRKRVRNRTFLAGSLSRFPFEWSM